MIDVDRLNEAAQRTRDLRSDLERIHDRHRQETFRIEWELRVADEEWRDAINDYRRQVFQRSTADPVKEPV